MVELDETGLFGHIIADLKAMGPIWEDLLLKSSKFYASIKQTAITADAFLDAFQKMADATTNSKGATRDIGVVFTKMVMRHRAIENKLKTYVGILADNLVTPMQECIDDWRKCSSVLEKDHAKDYKKLKSELKKASAEAIKLKKKASKKLGKQEYTEQYREAMKISNNLASALEDQEKGYLRKLMCEERSRAAYFFQCYQPVMQQELTMISEIEQLHDVITEAQQLCAQPSHLPLLAEDAIAAYQVPDVLTLGLTKEETAASPSSSPLLVRDRSLSINAPNTQKLLRRSATVPTSHEAPVNVPLPSWNSDGSARSSYSSNDSTPMYDPVTLQELLPHGNRHPADLGSPERQHNNHHHAHHINTVPRNSHTNSWSSIATSSDSSGRGSYNSLNTSHRHPKTSYPSGSSDCDVIEPDFPPEATPTNQKYATIDRSHFRRNKPGTQSLRMPSNQRPLHRSNSFNNPEDESFPDYKMNLPKSRTVRGGHPNRADIFQAFNRNTPAELLKRLSPPTPTNQQQFPPSPTYPNNQQQFPPSPTYPNNQQQFPPSPTYPNKQLPPPPPISPEKPTSPGRKVPPPTSPRPQMSRCNSSPAHNGVTRKPITTKQVSMPTPAQSTLNNEPEAARPGSFEYNLQMRRNNIRNKSVDYGSYK